MEGIGDCKSFQFYTDFINIVCFLFCVSEYEMLVFNVCLRIDRQQIEVHSLSKWVWLSPWRSWSSVKVTTMSFTNASSSRLTLVAVNTVCSEEIFCLAWTAMSPSDTSAFFLSCNQKEGTKEEQKLSSDLSKYTTSWWRHEADLPRESVEEKVFL